jgi:hypothetical protein
VKEPYIAILSVLLSFVTELIIGDAITNALIISMAPTSEIGLIKTVSYLVGFVPIFIFFELIIRKIFK